jgi:hypothetical protein
MGVTFTAESWTAGLINRHRVLTATGVNANRHPVLTASGVNRHRVNANRQWHFTRHRVSASVNRHGVNASRHGVGPARHVGLARWGVADRRIGQRPRESLDRGVVLRQCPNLELD